ncbi:unnamed protein product [Clavelina lepadiformis]|uniref:Uncharacterized protein n=1 Tax=Clavelina lepadiformis TaxID=159417 RepID=A0ABP0FAN4_CLALP
MDNLTEGSKQVSTSFAIVPYSTNGVLSEFYEPRKSFSFYGIPEHISIKQDWQSNGVAGVVWEGAYVLGNYAAKNLDLKKKNVLELGAGTGLVGMAMAKLGANVTVTDVKKALPLLQENIELNFPTNDNNSSTATPIVKELEWGIHLHKHTCCYDLIVGADIIYMEDSYDALITTLKYFMRCLGTKILLSAKLRYDRVECFISKLKNHFSNIDELLRDIKTNVVIFECF